MEQLCGSNDLQNDCLYFNKYLECPWTHGSLTISLVMHTAYQLRSCPSKIWRTKLLIWSSCWRFRDPSPPKKHHDCDVMWYARLAAVAKTQKSLYWDCIIKGFIINSCRSWRFDAWKIHMVIISATIRRIKTAISKIINQLYGHWTFIYRELTPKTHSDHYSNGSGNHLRLIK